MMTSKSLQRAIIYHKNILQKINEALDTVIAKGVSDDKNIHFIYTTQRTERHFMNETYLKRTTVRITKETIYYIDICNELSNAYWDCRGALDCIRNMNNRTVRLR